MSKPIDKTIEKAFLDAVKEAHDFLHAAGAKYAGGSYCVHIVYVHKGVTYEALRVRVNEGPSDNFPDLAKRRAQIPIFRFRWNSLLKRPFICVGLASSKSENDDLLAELYAGMVQALLQHKLSV